MELKVIFKAEGYKDRDQCPYCKHVGLNVKTYKGQNYKYVYYCPNPKCLKTVIIAKREDKVA